MQSKRKNGKWAAVYGNCIKNSVSMVRDGLCRLKENMSRWREFGESGEEIVGKGWWCILMRVAVSLTWKIYGTFNCFTDTLGILKPLRLPLWAIFSLFLSMCTFVCKIPFPSIFPFLPEPPSISFSLPLYHEKGIQRSSGQT